MLRGHHCWITAENRHAELDRRACNHSVMQLRNVINPCCSSDHLVTNQNNSVVTTLGEKVIWGPQINGDAPVFRQMKDLHQGNP